METTTAPSVRSTPIVQSVLDDRNFEEDFTEVYNTYKRLVYHTAYKIMDDSYLAEDVLQEVLSLIHI